MIKLTLLYSVLNGDLIPWLNCNDEFTNQVDPCYLRATSSFPSNDIELQKQLNTLVGIFPRLKNYLKTQEPENPTQLVHSFYSIHLPQHTDTFTAYYYLTFRQEVLRLFNLIINRYSEMDNEMKTFLVNDKLKELKYLALSITEKMKEKGYTQTPNPHTEPVLYALYAARYFVVNLYFEIQEVFMEVVKSPIIAKAFFQTFLKEIYNDNNLQPSRTFYEHKLMVYIDNNYFSFETIREIFDTLKTQQNIEKKELVVAKYENAIYLHSLKHNPGEIKNLLNQTLVTELFNSRKSAIQNEINKHHIGIDRLDVVNTELNQLFYTNGSLKNHHSIPSLLYHWLSSQAVVYTNAASNAFQAVAEHRHFTEPNKIIKEVNNQEQKAIAHQHLSFLKGTNPQNQIIMSGKQFDYLIDRINYLIETDLVPEIKDPLPQINLPTNYVRFTFYRLYKSLYTTKAIKDSWINFLHDMFTQFKNAERKTTKAKFSEIPPMYFTDFQQLKK